MQEVVVLDRHGKERDRAWLIAQFGQVRLERAPDDRKAYRLVRLQEVDGPAILLVHVVGEEGEPLSGIPVVWSWAGAPELPTWPRPTSRWKEWGVLGPTDARGTLAFGLGTADAYSVPQAGPACAWVADPAGPSDLVSGLGMLASANHRHLDPYFQLVEPEAEPAPVSVPQPVEARIERAQPPTSPKKAPVPVAPAASGQRASQAPATAVQTVAPLQVESLQAAASTPTRLTDAQWNLLISRLDAIIQTLERRLRGSA